MKEQNTAPEQQKVQSRLALLPARDEIITTEHVQALIDSEVEELVKLKHEDVQK
jgi:hypothetical protein